MASKYWSEMNILSNSVSDSVDTGKGFIISKEPPVKYQDDKKVILSEGITENEYEEVASFYQKYNRMSTGNTTLLPVEELKRYLSLNNISLLMRSSNGMLIGTIISIIIPVKNRSGQQEEIIIHGCTTFLAVHPTLRKMGLCMALIRKLIELGYERGLYCDYHMVSFPIGSNSVSINSWYRPINLTRAKELGFLYAGLKDPHNSTKLRLKYTTKLPLNHSYVVVNSNNINISLKYYKKLVTDRIFSFWPDKKLWLEWTKAFPTYLIYNGDDNNNNNNNNKKIVGIVSLNTIYCVITETKETGKILFPIICDGEMESVMSVICSIAKDLDYDVVYFHQHGNISDNNLDNINAIKTTTKLFFSLYNNNIKLSSEDINVPLL